VIVADVSEVALRLAIGRSRAAGLNMEGVVLDLSSPWFPKDCFDLILNFYFLERGALPVYGMSLKPGGLLFFETLVRHGSKGERPAHYLESGELTAAFAGWDILHLGRTEHVRHSSRRCRITEQLIARRPA
jgi:SAM-dependent methyltransferase